MRAVPPRTWLRVVVVGSLAFAAACGSATAARPPVSSPPAPTRAHPPERAGAALHVEPGKAHLQWSRTGQRVTVNFAREATGAELLPEDMDPETEVRLTLAEGVVASLDAGAHAARDVREAVFVQARRRRELRAGERLLTLVALDDELDLGALASLLGSFPLPVGRGLVVVGGRPRFGNGVWVVADDSPASRRALLAALARPHRGPPWLRDVVGAYLADRHLLRHEGGDGLAWLRATYRAHRAHLGRSIAEGDLEGGMLVAFCVDIDEPLTLPLSARAERTLRTWGALRAVVDLDACLRRLGSRLVARVVRHFEPASLQAFFGGAVLEGEPLVVRQPGGPLRRGDVLVQLGDRPIETVADVEGALETAAPGERIRARIRRGDTERRLWLRVPELTVAGREVRFEARPSPTSHPRWPFAREARPDPTRIRRGPDEDPTRTRNGGGPR